MQATLPPPTPEQDAEQVARRTQTVICLSKLPPFHPAALKLLNVASESSTAIDDFEEIFKADPALTADLLLVANSPLFGNRATIAAIRHAITHLGVERVRSLSTTIALSFFVRNQPRTAFVRHIWAHSIATAAIVDVLGRLYGQTELYTAGLTHDLGRLGLLLTVGQKYEQWVSSEVPTIQEANLAERAQFGMNHCEAGSLVGHKWGFPVLLRSCMIAHHDPPENQPGDPLSLVQLACRMAGSIGYPEVHQQPEEFPELPEKARKCKDLAPEKIRELVDKRIQIVGS